jgi:aryl-alcohol dehydrogenase-like predicted oxidoreductase
MEVSRIAFGTWQLGGDWGSFDESGAVDAIRHANELGVTLFDTAHAYGFGRAEQVLGNALRPVLARDRESVVIATKGGINPGSTRPRDASRNALRRGVEQSLQALDVDYIDLYQVHWPDENTPADETAGSLRELIDEGKIRHAGVSNYTVNQMREFERTRPVETLQPPYHLFQRGIEKEILPYTRKHNIGVLAYSPLASGLLTGRMTVDSTFESDDWRAHSSAFSGESFRRNLDIVDRLFGLAAACGITVSQLAIAWVLAQPGVHVAIVGARRARHIEESVAAGDVILSDAELAEIDRITVDAVPIEGATPEGVS